MLVLGRLLLFSRSLLLGLSIAILLGWLLLFALVLLVTRVPGQGLLENLEDLLVLDLLVRLVLADVKGRRATEPREAVLGDG